MPALHGVGVLVTRPEGQSAALCRLLTDEGADAIPLPAIEILPTADGPRLVREFARQRFDLYIFTSANAVRFGATVLGPGSEHAVAAIGPATARALEREGYAVTLAPDNRFDSESLLAEPHLADMTGRRVLLVKGRQGRMLLQDELTRRGADVVPAEVYQRRPAVHAQGTLHALEADFALGRIQVITATSAEIAIALLDAATPAMRRAFDRSHWLVPGPRVAGVLRDVGLTAPLLQAASAEDHDLVVELVRWRRIASGA